MALRATSFDNASDLAAFAAGAQKVASAAVVDGGGSYAVDDILTVVGGTGELVATLKVTGETLGVINTVSVEEEGAYTSSPANPVSVVGGSGLGATFNLTLSDAVLQADVLSVETIRHRWYLLYWV
jgi:hypothetical protein